MKTGKLLWSLFTFFAVMTLSLGFASCGDDDEDEDPSKISEDEQKFIGSWHNGEWVFLTNGKLLYNKKYYHFYTWKYNSSTGILATDVIDSYYHEPYQWEITIVGEDTWNGLSLIEREKHKSYSYKRDSGKDLDIAVQTILCSRIWKSKSDEFRKIGAYDFTNRFLENKNKRYSSFSLDFKNGRAFSQITFDKEKNIIYADKDGSSYGHKFVIKNPFDYKNVSFEYFFMDFPEGIHDYESQGVFKPVRERTEEDDDLSLDDWLNGKE